MPISLERAIFMQADSSYPEDTQLSAFLWQLSMPADKRDPEMIFLENTGSCFSHSWKHFLLGHYRNDLGKEEKKKAFSLKLFFFSSCVHHLILYCTFKPDEVLKRGLGISILKVCNGYLPNAAQFTWLCLFINAT